MRAKYKAKWLEALRSGKYIQGRKWLKHRILPEGSFKYCCLGVMCELVAEDFGVSTAEYDTKVGKLIINFGANARWMPDEIALAIGLPRSTATALMSMNDEGGFTFREIADWIEENVPSDSEAETTVKA